MQWPFFFVVRSFSDSTQWPLPTSIQSLCISSSWVWVILIDLCPTVTILLKQYMPLSKLGSEIGRQHYWLKCVRQSSNDVSPNYYSLVLNTNLILLWRILQMKLRLIIRWHQNWEIILGIQIGLKSSHQPLKVAAEDRRHDREIKETKKYQKNLAHCCWCETEESC